MPSFALRPHILFLLILLVTMLTGTYAYAATDEQTTPDIARIVSPPLNDIIAPLESLILVIINDHYSSDTYHFSLLLDREPIDAKWDPASGELSYFPSKMLLPGDHVIEVYMSEEGGVTDQLVTEGVFTVEGKIGGAGGVEQSNNHPNPVFDLRAGTPLPRVESHDADFFRFNGRASMSAQFGDVDGGGSGYRQNPENTSIFDLSGYGKTGDTEYDMRLYMTADENSFEQPRNRYSFKLDEEGKGGFAVGDALPRLGPLTIDGLRLRGVNAWREIGPFNFNFAQGEARRETSTRYGLHGEPIQRGLGERRLWFARVGLWAEKPFSMGFSYLNGEEKRSDSLLTGKPGENTVMCGDATLKFDHDKGTLKGVFAESEFDPASSTDPAVPDQPTSSGDQARVVEGSYILGGHTLTVHWESIDSGFVSLGIPYIQQDREGLTFEDRLNLLHNTFNGRVFWERYENNLDDSLTFTTSATRYGGQIQYRFLNGGPTFQIGYTTQNRSNNADPGDTGQIDDSYVSENAAITQAFDFWGGQHSVRLSVQKTSTDNDARPSSNLDQKGTSVIMTSRWNSGVQLDFTYSNTWTSYPGRDTTNLDRYSVRAGYAPGGRKPNFWGMWERVNSSGDENTYNSDRDSFEFGMRWPLDVNLTLEGSARILDFTDHANGANNLSERIYRLILTQVLN
jgi:hypothetical protein